MTSLGDLPAWLRDGINIKEHERLDQIRSRVESFRAAYRRMTYEECLYILAKEFLERRRPRAWIVRLLMGRMNRMRNDKHNEDIAHLKTWSFRART